MAITTVAQARAEVLQRVRDPNNVQHADVILDVLTDAQRLVAVAMASTSTDATLTLTPRQVLYTYSAIASDVARILHVTYQGRALQRANWREFSHAHPVWLHAVGDVPRHWDVIGHNLLAVFPSPPTATRSVTVRYVPILGTLGASDALTIPSAHVPLMLDIAEEVLLLRARLFPSIEGAVAAEDRHIDAKTMRPPL